MSEKISSSFYQKLIATEQRITYFRDKYSAHDLKETLMNISADDMNQVLGEYGSIEQWHHLQQAMNHLYEIPDSHLAALIEFHNNSDCKYET